MKYADWDKRLADYLNSVRKSTFDWATLECLSFSNEAVKAQTGQGFADDWVGNYSCAKSAYKFYLQKQKSEPEKDIIGAVDNRLQRCNLKIAPRGSVVARPQNDFPVLKHSFGIVAGDLLAFLGYDGLVFDNAQKADIFWTVQ